MEPRFFANGDEFYEWLRENHDKETELLVGFYKKKTGMPSMTWKESVDQALCFGWIDGKSKSLGEESFVIRFTPRRKGSVWSKVNVANVERLVREGKMTPAGMAAVEAAKADGRWEAAYDSSANSTGLEDLHAALAENPKARAFYETLNRQNTYAIQHRLQITRKPETRAKKLQQFVEMLERGESIYPQGTSAK